MVEKCRCKSGSVSLQVMFAETQGVQWSKSGSLSLDGLDPLCRVVDEDGRGGGLVMCAFNGDVGIVCIAS